MELNIGYSLELFCANTLERVYAGSLFQKYESVLKDDELINHDLNFYQDNVVESTSLWKRKCDEYGVANDPFFFIYCMSLYHGILDEAYGYSFLYGEAEELATNDDLNKVLTYIEGQGIEEIKNDDEYAISY